MLIIFLKGFSEPKQKVNPKKSIEKSGAESALCGIDFSHSDSQDLYGAFSPDVETGQSYKYTKD